MTETRLWDRMLPQAKELLSGYERRFPATTEIIEKTLKNDEFANWTELPYYIVKLIHERIFNPHSLLDSIEEEEVRMLFKDYYDK